jgi:PIN domain nuclease of toxin-antitoxin system
MTLDRRAVLSLLPSAAAASMAWPAGATTSHADVLDRLLRQQKSAATAWEITAKCRIGKLSAVGPVAADVAREIAAEGFAEFQVTIRHAQQAGAVPRPRKDPFDHLLIAQALTEAMTLVSNEARLDSYGVERMR